MGSEEVSVVRALGKRAKAVVGGLWHGVPGEQGDPGEDDGEGWDEVGAEVLNSTGLIGTDVDEAVSPNAEEEQEVEEEEALEDSAHDPSSARHKPRSRRTRRNSSSSISSTSSDPPITNSAKHPPPSPQAPPHPYVTASKNQSAASLEAAKSRLLSTYTTPHPSSIHNPANTSTLSTLDPPRAPTAPPERRLESPSHSAQPSSTKDSTARDPNPPQPHGSHNSHVLFGTLDMILTIVGECYGQRDLLDARDALWEIHAGLAEEDEG